MGNVTCPRSHGQFGREISGSQQRKEVEPLAHGWHFMDFRFVEVHFLRSLPPLLPPFCIQGQGKEGELPDGREKSRGGESLWVTQLPQGGVGLCRVSLSYTQVLQTRVSCGDSGGGPECCSAPWVPSRGHAAAQGLGPTTPRAWGGEQCHLGPISPALPSVTHSRQKSLELTSTASSLLIGEHGRVGWGGGGSTLAPEGQLPVPAHASCFFLPRSFSC